MIERIAELDLSVDARQFAVQALEVCVAATGARLGWLCLGSDPRDPSFTATTGADAESVRRGSIGIVEEALGGRIVVTTDASLDPRFRDFESVQRGPLQVVLCAPIGCPPVGVVYLQGGRPPGDEEVKTLELAARLMAPLARELLWHERWEHDPTAEVRARFPAPGIIGRSRAVAALLQRVALVAPSRVSVLIEGPTGTGKTLLARALHDASGVAGPFVTVDCTLLRGERASAELFGARRGAWTGLNEDREGWWEHADGGTIFLDEVGELPLDVQTMLLGVLQTGTWTRLFDRRVRRATVRVASATNRDLDGDVVAGRFRADLLHRLDGYRVRVPSLAERREDIGLVAASLAFTEAEAAGIRPLPTSPAAQRWLERRDWPGNVRELANAVRRGLLWANAEGADAIAARHLEQDAPMSLPPAAVEDDLRSATREFRRAHVARILEAEDGNVTRAARRLGISRTHLHEILRQIP